MKKKLLLTAVLGGLVLTSCGTYKPSNEKLESNLYVNKVENISNDFILGMDTSCVLSLEESGVKYYDYQGNEQDVFKTLADSGINYIRVRVWNDPFDKDHNGYGGGNCNIDTAVEIGKRASKYGMKLLVNFHYSDFWADPAKQMCPKAWVNMDIEEKSNALYEYTKESLQKLKKAKVDVGMVQIGNETNGAMAGEKVWFNIQQLMKAGIKASREVFKNAKVAVHFANPEKVTNYQDYASKLNYYQVDYDVFASSYYPYWHGTLENLSTVLSDIAEKYNKQVMVAENSYAYCSEDFDFSGNTISDGGTYDKAYPFTVQGQANEIRNVIDTLVNKTKNAIGYFYWEGTWIGVGKSTYEENFALWEKYGSGWASSYASEYDPKDAGKYYGGCAVENQALFDNDGKPLESLKVFNLIKHGNNVALKPDAIEDVNIICDLNGKIELPTTVNAIMSDDSKKAISVTWNNVDYDTMYNNGVAKYEIVGIAEGMEAHSYVSMVEYNFIDDYSFESGELKKWELIENGKANELYVEKKKTDSLTGEYHMHFWPANKDSVNFDLQQKVENLPAGTYKYSIAIMGGDCGTTNIYAYVKIDGEIAYKQEMSINGYNNWDVALIDNIEYDGEKEIIVGIHVEASGEGNGAWGKIDDALLNSKAK